MKTRNIILVTALSAEPSYEGLIVSLNGLMEVSK